MLIEGWQKDGVLFHTVGQKIEDTPEGRVLRQVMGSFAEMEHTKTRERSLRGIRKRVESGFPHATTAPYGYCWKKLAKASTLEVDDNESEVVQRSSAGRLKAGQSGPSRENSPSSACCPAGGRWE